MVLDYIGVVVRIVQRGATNDYYNGAMLVVYIIICHSLIFDRVSIHNIIVLENPKLNLRKKIILYVYSLSTTYYIIELTKCGNKRLVVVVTEFKVRSPGHI